MKIERLELFGYIRLMLTNIQHFVYTPEAPFQIILGTNGCGKSSILFELSPLPAFSNQYSKDGFKKIQISHKGSQYLIESSFRHGNKHSFKKDGEELNAGGTGMVQKELVRREFNYTQELHELLIGESRFTEMAPMKRREWITMLDSLDYTYSLGVYNKLRSTARDHQGTLKHLRQRLTQETNNLKTLVDTEGMEERGHQLHQELNLLLTQRLPNLPALGEIQSRVHGLIQRIEALANSVVKHAVPMPPDKTYQSVTDVTEDLTRLDSDMNTQQTLLARSTTEYSELESVMGEFTQNGEVSLENVDQYLAECDQEIDGLKPQVQLFFDLPDADLIRRDNEQILDLVSQLFSQMPDNSDRRYNREASEQARQKIREEQSIVSKGMGRLNQIAARLQVINSAKDSNCPQCGYVWREGFSEAEVEQNEQWIVEHEAIVDAAQARIKGHETFLEESEAYSALYTQFRGYVNNYPRLRPLWDYVLQNKLLVENPSGNQGIFLTWRRDVETNAKLMEWQRKRQHLSELVERQRQMGGSTHFTQRMAKLSEEIGKLTVDIGGMREHTKDVRQYRDKMLRMTETTGQLEAAMRDLEHSQAILIDSLRNKNIDQVVHGHQMELASIQHRLTEKRTLEGVVTDLSSSHDTVQLDHEVYSLLTKALSPDEGLIAEQLSGFIGCLVAQLNSVISSVWTYDLMVLSCGIESGDLNYKFPLQVISGDRVVADIGMGSKGQKALVNFAFQLTVMLYMGMEEFPLYLDEPGEGFDEQHRVNLMNFIKQLMDSGRHSQLFMISHFATSHGAFVSAEILVLDSANIAVPSGHNKHVLMT